MQETTHPRRRITSEKLRRKLARIFVDRINTCIAYQKTPEEKLKLKQVQNDHKRALKLHYGNNYNQRKIHNLPTYVYEITPLT